MKDFRHACRLPLRLAVVPAAVLGILMSAGAAQATPLGPGDLDKARAAASSPEASVLLQRALTIQNAQTSGIDASSRAAEPGAQAAKSEQKATIDPAAIPVYALNPRFVKGDVQEAGTLWYVAFGSTQGTSRQMLFTAPDASGSWKPVNVASGDTEQRMSALAKGGTLLFEPQIGAWYAISDHQIRALNHSAVTSIGKNPISLASYQHKVAASYGDKMPGSAYDRSGAAGGFGLSGPTTGKGESQIADQAANSVEPGASPVMQRIAIFGAVAVVSLAAALGWAMTRIRSRRS